MFWKLLPQTKIGVYHTLRLGWRLSLLSLSITGCGPGGASLTSFFSTATPTPLPIEVQVVYVDDLSRATDEAQDSGASTTSSDDTMPVPSLIPTDTPMPAPTNTPHPTETPTPPVASLPLTTTIQITTSGALTSSTETFEPQVSTAQFEGSITLLAPNSGFFIPSTDTEIEFKWRWEGSDPQLAKCEVPEGYGWELRIWPAQTGFGPMGAMDAAKISEDVLFGCDQKTINLNYVVKSFKDQPGIKAGAGSGKFLWDVAFVQLDPYQPVVTTAPRIFELPAAN